MSNPNRVEPSADPRIAAFCSRADLEVFHSIAYAPEIYRPDPYDVETIHAQPREVFERLLHRATSPGGAATGRILLLLGESGSGKTHLMRAFRNHVHRTRIGYCGYMQMLALTSNYGRYVLGNLIDSLDRPYYEPDGDTSGLMRLANALVETPHSILPDEVTRLREEPMSSADVATYVNELADLILADGTFSRLDIDLVRTMLYLQRDDSKIKSRALKYLRCEDLAPADREVLGGLVPRTQEESPQKMIEHMGRLIWASQQACLVICIDQLEEMYNLDEAGTWFRRAMATIRALADHVPSLVVVISCLRDYYDKLKGSLTQPLIDRIEKDPEQMVLVSQRGEKEIEDLIARRLMHLYESQDVAFVDTEPTFPFTRAQLGRLQNFQTRTVLDWCRQYRDRSLLAGQLVDIDAPDDHGQGNTIQPTMTGPVIELAQLWNDFRTSRQPIVPETEADLARVLAEAIIACSKEMESGHQFSASANDRLIEIEVCDANGQSFERLLAGVCNRAAQGGGLGRQIQQVVEAAGDRLPVLVRSTEYPSNPRAKISQQIGQLITGGGRRVVVQDADWRTMVALAAFRGLHGGHPDLQRWLREEKPLTRLQPLRGILRLDEMTSNRAAPPISAPYVPPLGPSHANRSGHRPPTAQSIQHSPLLIGDSSGRLPLPISIEAVELIRHAAFLGGTGSGKTTLALNLIEQLLLQDVPVVLIDRKGDLCGYARPEAWNREADSETKSRLQQLRDRLDVVVYTPGNPSGNPLSIRIIPNGIEQLPRWEREQVAGYAAYALAGMMAYRDRGQDASRVAILRQAIALLSAPEVPGEVTLDELIGFISDQDPALVSAIGQLDTRLFKRLVQDLQTLRLNKGELLAAHGDQLEAESLLGLGRHRRSGKTRLSVISTKFLGDNANVEFWVAQLLLEFTRWVSRNPAAQLQAVILLDEADLYLPAQRKPATKDPMENLLKRGRSGGLGLFLASQSPGDLDYKSRDNIGTWFLGRITQATSITKMRPMLSECGDEVAAKLPGLATGQFYFVRAKEKTSIMARQSLMPTEQLPEDCILELARSTARRGTIA